MKIAFILYGKADKRSGGFLYDRHMIDYLIQRGHNVKIFSQKEGSFFSMLLENSRKKISPVISFSPDLIIEDELNHTSLFIINNYLKKKINVKILSVVHHLRSDERLNFILKTIFKFIEYYYLKSCDLFICNSRTTCRSVEKLVKNKKFESIVIYPGKDNLPEKDRKNRNSDIVNFLFTGNLIPRKNIHKLIRNIQPCLNPGRFVFVSSKESLDLPAEQLFRPGRLRGGLYHQQQCVDRVRVAGGGVGTDPDQHHVQGHEPVVGQRALRHHGPDRGHPRRR